MIRRNDKLLPSEQHKLPLQASTQSVQVICTPIGHMQALLAWQPMGK